MVTERVVGSSTHLDWSYISDRHPHCFDMDKAFGICCEGSVNSHISIDHDNMWWCVHNV